MFRKRRIIFRTAARGKKGIASRQRGERPCMRGWRTVGGRFVKRDGRAASACLCRAHLRTGRSHIVTQSDHDRISCRYGRQAACHSPPLGPRRPARDVLPGIPQASGDGRLDHSLIAPMHRSYARARRLGADQGVRRIWPGRRHLHPADPRADVGRRDAGGDQTFGFVQIFVEQIVAQKRNSFA